MDKKDHIPMPTPMERRAAIRRIAEEGLADTAPAWRSLPLSDSAAWRNRLEKDTARARPRGMACPLKCHSSRSTGTHTSAEEGLADTAPAWRSLPLSALVFGVEDCLFMAALLGLLPLALLTLPARLLAEKLPLTLRVQR